MNSIEPSVKVMMTVYFRDGRTKELVLDQTSNKNVIGEILKRCEVSRKLSMTDDTPVGTVCSSNSTFTILSEGEFVPDNKLSVYYGFMDNTAIITLTVADSLGNIAFGIYFVDSWTGTISSSAATEVLIDAYDIFSIKGRSKTLGNMMPLNTLTRDYVIMLIDELNEGRDDKYKIKYRTSDLNFGKYGEMQCCGGVGSATLYDALNTISKCTLTNIYIDRDNYIKTLDCLDSSIVSAGELSDCTNVLKASTQSGTLGNNNDDVNVKYVIPNVSEVETLLEIQSKYTDGEYFNIDTNCNLERIVDVQISEEDGETELDGTLSYLKYTRDKIDMQIDDVEVDKNIVIKINGIKVNEITKETGINKSSKNELNISNPIVKQDKINEYRADLLKLIAKKNKILQVEGYFSPRLKVGDIVYVDLERTIGIKGYYRIIEETWVFESTCKGTFTLSEISTGGD